MVLEDLKRIECEDGFIIQSSNEEDVIACYKEHFRRNHGSIVSDEQVRPMIKSVVRTA